MPNYNNLPEQARGKFKVMVMNMLHRPQEKDQEKLIWQLEVTDGPHEGCNFAKYSNYGTTAGWEKLQSDLGILGLTVDKKEDIDEVMEDLNACEVLVRVSKKKTDNGNYRSVEILKEVKDTEKDHETSAWQSSSGPFPHEFDGGIQLADADTGGPLPDIADSLNELCRALLSLCLAVQTMNGKK